MLFLKRLIIKIQDRNEVWGEEIRETGSPFRQGELLLNYTNGKNSDSVWNSNKATALDWLAIKTSVKMVQSIFWNISTFSKTENHFNLERLKADLSLRNLVSPFANGRTTTLQYWDGFAIHQYEMATDIPVSLLSMPPPTSLPTPSFQVVREHQL